ncbi:MAG: alpha/beta fold hydrolase [Jatrophihabitans sp.]
MLRPVRAHTLAPGTPGGLLVVLAHGLEDSWTSWWPLAAELNPDWRLVALDLPWRPGNDYRWLTHSAAHWLGDGLDLLGARPDLLVAHSFGANATLNLLCQQDLRPGSAVALVCPVYRQPKHQVTWQVFERARSIFIEHVREGLRARLGERAELLEPDVLEAMMEMAPHRVGPSGFLTVFQQFIASADLPLSEITVPTLLVAGGADLTLSRRAARALGDRIPGAEVRVNDDYDHFCHIRHARGIANQVATFVEAARAATG